MLYTDYLKYKVAKEELNISVEYNAFDWPRYFFPVFNQLYRGFGNDSKTSIEAPHLIVYLLTGKLTEFGKFIQALRSLTPMSILTMINPASLIWSSVTGEYKGQKEKGNNKEYGQVHDVWKLFMLNPDKVDFENGLDSAKKMVNEYVKGLQHLKTKVHIKIEPRPMTLGEKNAIKLFRPEEAKNDMEKAKKYIATKMQEEPEMLKKWQAIYATLEKGMMDYIKFVLDNISSNLPVRG